LRDFKHVTSKIHLRIKEIENLLSEFIDATPVFALNRAKAFEPVLVNREFFSLFKLAEDIRVESFGAFDLSAKSTIHERCFLELQYPKIQWSNGENSECFKLWKTHDDVRLSF